MRQNREVDLVKTSGQRKLNLNGMSVLWNPLPKIITRDLSSIDPKSQPDAVELPIRRI